MIGTRVSASTLPSSQARGIGRPLGEIAHAVLCALHRHPMTARQLAMDLRCSLPVMKKTCERLRASGRIRCVAKVRPAGSNRHAAVYHIVTETLGGHRHG